MTTNIYFVRHAEPDYSVHEDAIRPLTEKGKRDAEGIIDVLKDRNIEVALSSPYLRSVDTIKPFADSQVLKIQFIEDFRERRVESVWIENFEEFFKRQWQDFNYKLSDGECLQEVQDRNIKALQKVLKIYQGKNIVVGTHGTALSTIINYYDPSFGGSDFEKIRDVMPWIVKFTFEGMKCISVEKGSTNTKELWEMNLEELWQLFPIILKDHNPEYKNWYKEEEERLTGEFKNQIERISHIGSTAVEGLIAKPTVDILMEISRNSDNEKMRKNLEDMGWGLMNSTETPRFRQTYNKGYTKYGFAEKVYHLHLRYRDDWDELYFRDYLRDNQDTCDEYGKLKLSLWKAFEHDRDGYTEAKGEFISGVITKAREKYGNRYV